MSNNTKAIWMVAALLSFASLASAQGYSITSVSIANLQNPGRPVNYTQPQATAMWNVTASFTGGNSTISANITNSSVSYKQANGAVIKAAYNLLVNGSTSSGAIFFPINVSSAVPIVQLSSLYVNGTVSGLVFQSATAAPACPANRSAATLYTEWDYYITIQPTYGTQKNVVVGRVCIYKQTLGTAYLFAKYGSAVPSSTFELTANGRTEAINMNYVTQNSSSSADGLATMSWNGSQVGGATAFVNASGYAAVNSGSGWAVQNASQYSRFYAQYNSFTLQNIPSQLLSYSPTSIATLYASCNRVSGSTSITNASIIQSLQCMNETASVYYSLSNQLALELMSSGLNISGYTATPANVGGNAGFSVSVPTRFVLNPQFSFLLNGSFYGFVAPAGIPRIISANTTPIGLNGVGAVNLQVANIGTSASTFSVAISSCPGINTEPGVSYQIAQGQIGFISTAISAANTSLTLDEQCVVNVTSSSGQSTSQAILVRTATPNQYIHSTIDWLQAEFCANPLTQFQAICVGASV